MRGELPSFIRRRGNEALAAALTALVLAEVLLREGSAGGKLTAAAVAVVLGVAAARRVRAPLVFLGLMLAVSVAAAALPKVYVTANAFGLFLLLLLAINSAAAHTNGRGALIGDGLTVALYCTDLAMDTRGITAEGIVFYATLFGSPWVAGRAIRHRRLNDRQLEHENAKAAAAIVEERARIARELHDVVAHSISVMVLQARGGRRVLQSDPADARNAFGVIEETGQQDGSGSGYGLIGMRERVSVYGELQAGRQPGGGYALRFRLPLGSARP